MTTPDPAQKERLDSWKAISAYLKRDERTLRRWERELGLPIRRVAGGSSASVFALTAEIDDWLMRKPRNGVAEANDAPPKSGSTVNIVTGIVMMLVLAAVLAWWIWPAPADLTQWRAEVTAAGVTAYDQSGAQRWRHDFPADYSTAIPGENQSWAIQPGTPPVLFAATAAQTRHGDGQITGGTLMAFDSQGRLARTFAFDDQIIVGGTSFSAPWGITSLAVEPSAPYRVAISGHHYIWNPGIVTVLDRDYHRRGTFVHDGWIENVRWIAPKQLLIGGYSNAHEGGMVAILDVDELEGQGPEPPGSPHYCQTCGPKTPVRMAVLPRSEVNRAAAAPFNRAIIQITGDRILVRTVEVASEQGPAEAVYEFTTSLDLISGSFSERYWDNHRALEAAGKLRHSAAQCPDRDGPMSFETWDRLHGWQTVTVQRPR